MTIIIVKTYCTDIYNDFELWSIGDGYKPLPSNDKVLFRHNGWRNRVVLK